MIKFKWRLPFIPIATFALAPQHIPFVARLMHVVGVLALVVALLAAIQPWQPDRPSSFPS